MTIKKITTLLLGLAVSAAAFAANPEVPAAPENPKTVRSLVFSPGDFGSKFYRIPGIAVTNDGNIIAVADKRIDNNADLPNRIDVVARRSTDGGRTWSEYITVAEHNEDGGYGDPAVVVDRRTGDIIVISTHGNGLWQDAPGHTAISRSTDGGLTWEAPVDVADQILNAPGAPLQNVLGAFASSGAALQLRSGRIMFVLVVREKDKKDFSCYAVYSDDGGRKWNVSKNPGTYNGDEAKVVELADGTVIMSVRNRYRGKHIFSISKDGGETWGESFESDLTDPACNGDIIAVTNPATGGEVLLQSIPASPNDRVNVSIYSGTTDARHWTNRYTVVPGPSGYSSITQLPDGSIGILTEEDLDPDAQRGSCYRIWFSNVPLEDVLRGDPQTAGE
ncbi:MAG: glycoside hydrolase [Clostridium sp.]|nr:glycoside hydrolase [Clostridium sp.]